MFRPLFVLSAATLAAAPAVASTYSAKPVAPTTERFVARDINWTCASGSCSGATAESRPAVLCQALAKHAGRIGSFVVDGRAFTSVELDKCNTAAKAPANSALGGQ